MNPNQLCDPLKLRQDARRELCELSISDRRYVRARQERPIAITLSNPAFEATYLASYEDLEAIRDIVVKALAAMDAQNEAEAA